MKNIEITQVLKKLFASREISHVLHLGIQGEGSYATHKALETYYEEIPNLIPLLIKDLACAACVLDSSNNSIFA